MKPKLLFKKQYLFCFFLNRIKLLIAFAFLMFLQTGFAQGVTISPWKMNRGGGVISYNLASGIHGDPIAYSQMNIPAISDPNWVCSSSKFKWRNKFY